MFVFFRLFFTILSSETSRNYLFNILIKFVSLCVFLSFWIFRCENGKFKFWGKNEANDEDNNKADVKTGVMTIYQQQRWSASHLTQQIV